MGSSGEDAPPIPAEAAEEEQGEELSKEERIRRIKKQASALGFRVDFRTGSLIKMSRSQRRRKRRKEEEIRAEKAAQKAAAAEAEAKAKEIAKAAEATQAAMSFEQFLAQRSRAAAAPPKLATVPQELQKKIEESARERARKLKRKKQGRDYEYDESLDGESLESSEEHRYRDDMEGDPCSSEE